MKNKKIVQFLNDLNHQNEVNTKNLIQIINDNKETAYGKKYQFSTIFSVKDYQTMVPLSTYNDYKEGNECAYPVKIVLHTTGTTGCPKKINLTFEALKRYNSYIYDFPKELLEIDSFISVHTSVFDRTEQPTILSTAYYDFIQQKNILNTKNYVEKENFLFSSKKFPILYVKLRLALMEKDLNIIESIYLYEVDVLIDFLYKNWRLLINDIKRNECSVAICPSLKKKLTFIKCDQNRLYYLEELFHKHYGKPVLNLIWPKLSYISGIGQKNAQYVQRIKKYAPRIKIYYFAYASTECMCGIATKFDTDEYVLLPQSAFYEFQDDKQIVYLPSEVESGKKYELIITTFTGLYRYRTNDILLITGFEGQSPRFKVLGRRNKILNIAGEKVDEWTIHEAMSSIIMEYHLEEVDYWIGVDTSRTPCGYILFTNISNSFFDAIAKKLDKNISSLNEIYKNLRKKEFISQPYLKYFTNFEKYRSHFKPKLILTEVEVQQIKESL